MAKLKVPNKFLFMKVGNHANESWDQILARKRREYEIAGKTFWGYGGSACHPLNQVQPFSRLVIKEQPDGIVLVMEPINSRADQDEAAATEYSEDGVIWKPIPKGIKVTGSRYALVLDRIEEGDLDLQLDGYEVGIGPSLGKTAGSYLHGRTDKGCLVKRSAVTAESGKIVQKPGFMAKLQEPFAVLLRQR
jgi:hypothetical protein